MGAVGQGGDAGGGHLAVLAVVKADHGHILRDGDAPLHQLGHQTAGDLVVVAHHRRIAGEDLLQVLDPRSVQKQGLLGLRAVPEDLLVLEGEAQGAQGVGIAGVALVALDVVVFEDARDALVALLVEIVHQHPAACGVVVQHREAVGELGVVAVHKDQGDPPVDQPAVQVQVGVGQAGLGPLHQHPVQGGQVQKGIEHLPLVGHLVLGGKEQGGAVVVGEDVFHLSQNAGEDVVADVGGDDRDRAVGHGGRLGPVPDVGAAALPALNQPLRDQQGQGLPHGLAADLKLLAQELFGGQKHALLVDSVQNIGPERVRHHLIFGCHGTSPSSRGFQLNPA